jgi:hypothetical protein
MPAHVSDVLNRQLAAFEFKADSIALSLKHHFFK